MTIVSRTIEIDVAIVAAFERWTRFEEFPRFMDWVERVEPLAVPIGPTRTQVGLTMRVVASDPRDVATAELSALERRVSRDLERSKRLVEGASASRLPGTSGGPVM